MTEKGSVYQGALGMGMAQLHPEIAAQQRKREERFIEDCAFAKIVSTADGDALKIGYQVIGIRSSNPSFHVEMISKALRRASQEEVVTASSPISVEDQCDEVSALGEALKRRLQGAEGEDWRASRIRQQIKRIGAALKKVDASERDDHPLMVALQAIYWTLEPLHVVVSPYAKVTKDYSPDSPELSDEPTVGLTSFS